ncbi:MAG: hypothetical protein MZU97_11705 [Bacillus subtilis]|nr:hypothetical protein [Bacillus subtilis]
MIRKDYISWDQYFMGVAYLSAMRSKDENSAGRRLHRQPEEPHRRDRLQRPADRRARTPISRGSATAPSSTRSTPTSSTPNPTRS